mmetsp:Transcript_22/g.83  ORF Transcript_22/g.83 Transcript_22/m.83 type:complete len:255 (+) Transcript_22:1730-2494(+)
METRHTVLDSVDEAAGGCDDGHSAVLHGVHLDQPARLEPRRHQHEVAASCHEVGQGAIELHHAGGAAGEQGVDGLHLGLQVGFAGTQDGHLGSGAALERLGQRLQQHVHPLLLLQPPNEAEEGRLGVDLQAQQPLQSLLGDGLALGHSLLVILDIQELVLGGAPLAGVHAVHDALDAAHRPDNTIELHTQLGPAGHLLGVGGRHRQQLVRRQHACLQPVELVVLDAGCRQGLLIGVLRLIEHFVDAIRELEAGL